MEKQKDVRLNKDFRNAYVKDFRSFLERQTNNPKYQSFLEARENFENKQTTAFELARQVVERSYPMEDVNTLRQFKKKYGDPCDVVAKDKCFYFSHNEDVDEDGDSKETKSHFDFGLYGNLNGNEYGDGENCELYAQQSGKDNNPHKTKHVDANNKFLGKSGRYDDNIGMAKTFDKQFELDVIGTSHCRSRAIACTKNEYEQFEQWRMAKANVVSKHQTWIDSITKQCDQLKIGLKAYRYLSEGIELATELGIEVDEAELVRTNSTGLTIYNPSNLASMIKGMKNKNQTREDKIKARLQYEKQSVN